MTAKNLALATITTPGTITSRTIGDRFAEVFNWKDYGAIGDAGNHPLSDRFGSLGAAQAVYPHATALTEQIDWAAIQAAVNAMYDAGGGNCYGPPGLYNMGAGTSARQIDLGGGPSVCCGSFTGAGEGATTIFGTFNDDYLVNMPHQTQGVGYVADMSILNFSAYIGTGALRYCQSSGQGVVKNLLLGGMGSLEMGWNIFNTTVIGITAQGNGQTVSPYGSVGATLSGASVYGWREAAGHEIGMVLSGQQSVNIESVSFEITPVGMVLGQTIFFATKATITGPDGSKVLTVAPDGVMYPPASATADPITSTAQIVTSGVDPRLNPEIRIGAQLTDTSVAQGGKEQGTYSLTGADGVTISTPQPITIRKSWPVGNFRISGVQTEGAVIGIFLMAAGNGTIDAAGIGGVITQGCTNQYSGIATGTYSCSPYAGIFVLSASHTTILSGGAGVRTSKAAMMFHGAYMSAQHLTLIGVLATPGSNSPPAVTTDANAFIDDGTGATLVTNALTASGNDTLHFAAGTIPASVVAGVPVFDATNTSRIPQNTRVIAKNNGAGTVQLSKNVNGVSSGDTIKFCVPSGVAGGVLTVQDITGVFARGPDVHAPGLDIAGASLPKGGGTVAGSGVGTGSNTPMIRDQIGGYNGGNWTQYTLIKSDGSAVSLNLSARVFTSEVGKAWGVDNLTGLSGIGGSTKSGITLINCNNDSTLDMLYADLPGESGVSTATPVKGMRFDIINGQKSGGGTAALGDTVSGGGSQFIEVKYTGTVWVRSD
jgi:hypothetical protein